MRPRKYKRFTLLQQQQQQPNISTAVITMLCYIRYILKYVTIKMSSFFM